MLFLFKHLSHKAVNQIGYHGAESISGALQSNTSLKSLDISCVLFVFKFLTQQLTALVILVLRAFRWHSNQTLHSHHLLFTVCCFVKTLFTQQLTILVVLVLRVFLEHSNQTLHSHHLVLAVCCFDYTSFTNTR